MKKVYLINPYGGLPNEEWVKYRTVFVSEELIKRGFSVVWLTSTFRHRTKTFRDAGRQYFYDDKLTIVLLSCGGYEQSISLARVRFERTFMKGAYEVMKVSNDIGHVIMFEPSIFYGFKIYRFMHKSSTKYSVDVLDLWPEIFKIFLPRSLSFLFVALFFPFLQYRKMYMRRATVILGASKDYLIPFGKLQRPSMVSYIGYDDEDVNESMQSLDIVYNLPLSSIKICYAGTFGANYDIETVLFVAARTRRLNVSWILIGQGEKFNWVKTYIDKEELTNVTLLNGIPKEQLCNVYKQCDIGLAPYVEGSSVSMPLKFYDYVQFGLPIVTSLTGEVKEIVQNEGIGLVYESGSIDSLCLVINDLATDPLQVETMKKNMSVISPKYSSREQHKLYVDFLELNDVFDDSK